MKNATFWILDTDNTSHGLMPEEILACDLAALHWRQGKRVLLHCERKPQAIKMDQALWEYPVGAFIPHYLAGDGAIQGAAIEIAYTECRGNSPRDLLITLSPSFPDFATAFQQVIDFVPHEKTLKARARERYKIYRDLGFHLTTSTVLYPKDFELQQGGK